MPLEPVTLGVSLLTALAGLGSALAALRTSRAARATAEASQAQAEAALGQATAAQEQSRARLEEIDLLRARLHRELATESRDAIERGHAVANSVSDAIWAGAGNADQSARSKQRPQSDPTAQAFLAAFRDLLRNHASQLALLLGLQSDEWAGLQYAGSMLRNIELGGDWFTYEDFNDKHGGFLALLLAVERRLYARLSEYERFLRAPIDPPTERSLPRPK